MYIAMNRFKIVPGQEEAFEAIWRNRRTRLHEMEGFVDFKLLRGGGAEDHTLFASHAVWRSQQDFEGWLKSEAFGASHQGEGRMAGIVLGHPEFEGFEVRLDA